MLQYPQLRKHRSLIPIEALAGDFAVLKLDDTYEGELGSSTRGSQTREHPVHTDRMGKAYYELFVYGKRRLPADVREAGATVCDTLKTIAERSEIVVLMVPDTPDVRSVLFDR